MTPHRKLIALDFDGVIHSYSSPWTDAATIADGPTPGAMQFLKNLVDDDRFEVCIVSSRCKEPSGVEAIKTWLAEHIMSACDEEGVEVLFRDSHPPARVVTERKPIEPWQAESILREIQVVAHRPPAFVTIDDRALTFDGTWPSLETLAAFRPWNKPASSRPLHVLADPSDDLEARCAKGFDPEDTMTDEELRRQQVANWALEQVVGGVRGFGIEQGDKGFWHVLMQDGSPAFSVSEDVLPADQPGAGRKIVGAIYSAWVQGVRSVREPPETDARKANDKALSFASSKIEAAVHYARTGGAGFDTEDERNIAELGARRAISMLTREAGMHPERAA